MSEKEIKDHSYHISRTENMVHNRIVTAFCPLCKRTIGVRKDGLFKSHRTWDNQNCKGSYKLPNEESQS